MSEFRLLPRFNSRRLNLGGGGGGGGGGFDMGGRSMEYILAGALALIIIGSLVMTIWYSAGGNKPDRSDHKMMFKCEECGEEFEHKPEGGPEGFMMEGPEMGISRIDCPKCGKEKCAVPMVRCPNPECKKYYVSQRLEYEKRLREGTAESDEAPLDICPYCDTDRIKWYRDHRKKKRKKK